MGKQVTFEFEHNLVHFSLFTARFLLSTLKGCLANKSHLKIK